MESCLLCTVACLMMSYSHWCKSTAETRMAASREEEKLLSCRPVSTGVVVLLALLRDYPCAGRLLYLCNRICSFVSTTQSPWTLGLADRSFSAHGPSPWPLIVPQKHSSCPTSPPWRPRSAKAAWGCSPRQPQPPTPRSSSRASHCLT